MNILGIIPARYASTRFPGKPLALLQGKPMIQHVYERVKSCLDEVVVATDDQRIFDVVESFGGRVVMTSENHTSGTDRSYEAFMKLGANFDVVVNIQGDEPFIQTDQIEQVCACFEDKQVDIATLVMPFAPGSRFEDLNNANTPKVVVDKRNFALYFSRSIIPFIRGKEQEEWLTSHLFYKHIGLYAFRGDVLQQITQLPVSSLEKAESLEQLRWLENGYRIKVGYTEKQTIGIDTPEDLEHANRLLENNNA